MAVGMGECRERVRGMMIEVCVCWVVGLIVLSKRGWGWGMVEGGKERKGDRVDWIWGVMEMSNADLLVCVYRR